MHTHVYGTRIMVQDVVSVLMDLLSVNLNQLLYVGITYTKEVTLVAAHLKHWELRKLKNW